MVADLGMGYAMVITASIAAVASVLNTALAFMLKRFVTPPSGNTLGQEVELAHHESSAAAAGIKALIAQEHARTEERRVTPPEGIATK